jgi:hypothetical protein
VLFDGVSIEVEDPDTAIELAEKIAKRKGSQQASQVSLERGPMKEHDVPGEGSGAQAPEDAWAALMEALSAPHHRLLALIKEKEAIAIDELAQALGAKNNSVIAGLQTIIKRNAKKVGLDPEQLYSREIEGSGPSRIIRYRPGPLLNENDVPTDTGTESASL